MSIQKTNTSSGSLYPSKKTLDAQLRAHENKEYNEQPIQSKILNITTRVWSQAQVDLSRLGNLVVSGKEVYSLKNDGSRTSDELRTAAYDSILTAVGTDDMVSTALIINLLQQGVLLDVLRDNLNPAKNLLDSNGTMTHAQFTKEKISVVTVEKGTFSVTQEIFVKQVSRDDPEDETKFSYYKVKVIVSGDLASLKAAQTEKLDFRAMYTKEYKNETEAKKANYFGIKAAGWTNSVSYLN